MSQLTAYAGIQEQCANVLILLTADDPDPQEIESHLSTLATLQEALQQTPPSANESRESLLQAAKETLRLTTAIRDAANDCHERLRAAQARSERTQQALSAYRDDTTVSPSHFIDQQR